MILNLNVRYLNSLQEVLCFKHAVQAAMKGEKIDVEIDDYDSEYDMRNMQCVMCQQENRKADLKAARKLNRLKKQLKKEFHFKEDKVET